HGLRVIGVELVVSDHGHLGAQFLEEVREVVREAVVVVDEQDSLLHGDSSASSIAASRAASLFRHSWCSDVGSDSATMPPPAWSIATPSRRTSVLMAMHV